MLDWRKGGVLRTSFVDFYPWYVPYTNSEGKLQVHGLFGSMIGNITQSMNFTYEMYPPPDGQYGMVLPDNTVNGQLLQLEKGEIEIGLGPFTYHWVMLEKFHVPLPPRYTHISILSAMKQAWVKKPAPLTVAFDPTTWSLLLSAFLAIELLWLLHQKFVLYPGERALSLLSNTVFTLVELLLQESTKNRFPDHYGRYLGGLWLVCSFFLGQFFVSQGKANLVVKSPTTRIDNLDMVLERPTMKVFYPVNTPIHAILLEIPGDRGARMIRHLESSGVGLGVADLYNENSLRDLQNGAGVIVMDRQSITTNVHTYCRDLKSYFYIGAENVWELPGIWVTSKNLPADFNEVIDRKIQWLLAMDVPFMTHQELYKGNTECVPARSNRRSETAEALTLQDVGLTFYYLICGQAVAMLLFPLEFLFYRMSLRGSENTIDFGTR